jgi:hypothetical protein
MTSQSKQLDRTCLLTIVGRAKCAHHILNFSSYTGRDDGIDSSPAHLHAERIVLTSLLLLALWTRLIAPRSRWYFFNYDVYTS